MRPSLLGYHSGFTTYSIVDERSAAFFALGIAQQLQKPVAVLCTLTNIILLLQRLITVSIQLWCWALMTSYQIDIGNGQTIGKRGCFQNKLLQKRASTRCNAQPSSNHWGQYPDVDFTSTPKEIERSQQAIEKKNNTGLESVVSNVCTKVLFILISLEEPLYDFDEVSDFTPAATAVDYPHTKQHKDFASKRFASKRILFVVGTLPPNR